MLINKIETPLAELKIITNHACELYQLYEMDSQAKFSILEYHS